MPRCVFVLAMLLVCSCDPVWVQERTITLRKAEAGCIVAALRKVPEVTTEMYRENPVLIYLKKPGVSQPIASIGAPSPGASEIIFLVPASAKNKLIQLDLNSVAANLESSCGT